MSHPAHLPASTGIFTPLELFGEGKTKDRELVRIWK